MKGLIIKDLFTLKRIYKNYIFVFLVFGFTAYISKNPYSFSAMLFILSFMLPVTALSLDDHYNWQKYALTMPVTRKDLVISKYILGLIFGVFSAIITTLIILIIPNSDMAELGLCLCCFFTLGLVFLSIMFPLILKFGTEKARILVFGVVGIPAILIIGISINSKDNFVNFLNNLQNTIWLLPIFGLIIATISMFISINIMNNKEF